MDGGPAQGETELQLRRLYDDLAVAYDRSTWPVEWLFLRRLRRRLLRSAAGRVLEVGIGTGANLPCYPDGVQVWGTDLSPEMLARAERRSRKLGLDGIVHLNAMDTQALAFPDGAFDTVVSTLSLCAPPDPLAALSQMQRVCRPQGRLLMMEHGRGRLLWVNRWLDRRAEAHRKQWGCAPNRDMEALIREAGCRIERVESHLWGMLKLFWARPGKTGRGGRAPPSPLF